MSQKFADTVWAEISKAVVKSGLFDDCAALASELSKATGEEVNASHVAAAIQRHQWDVARAARAQKAAPASKAASKAAPAVDPLTHVMDMFAAGTINKATMREMVEAIRGGANTADVARARARKTRAAAVATAKE